MPLMSFKFEKLNKFEAIFEIALGHDSRTKCHLHFKNRKNGGKKLVTLSL
jgi:hypothetical protein